METEVCSCCVCREPVTKEQMKRKEIGDNHVYSYDGSLKYIELYHLTCKYYTSKICKVLDKMVGK